MHEGIQFQRLGKLMGWNYGSMHYVEYKNQDCGDVVIVGNN